VPAGLLEQLADASVEFFALPLADKMEIAMERGGRAWLGFFPVGAELTSGRPDLKEGLYFGAELPADDPRVLAGLPLHGGNLFPRQVPRLRPMVLAYLDALIALGQAVLAGVALSHAENLSLLHHSGPRGTSRAAAIAGVRLQLRFVTEAARTWPYGRLTPSSAMSGSRHPDSHAGYRTELSRQLQVQARTSAMVMLSGPPASTAAFHSSNTARPS
jgi:non-haem dioxygenase in morphine synthesis N-terminal